MSGTTCRRGGRAGAIADAYGVPYALVKRRSFVPLSPKHELERAGYAIKHGDDNDYKLRRAEYRGLARSTDGRKRLGRLSALRVQLGVAQRRRITVRHMLHGDMVRE